MLATLILRHTLRCCLLHADAAFCLMLLFAVAAMMLRHAAIADLRQLDADIFAAIFAPCCCHAMRCHAAVIMLPDIDSC